ncbi:MAG: thioredoxin family protein [Pseudarcicella sp.]|nr:thioredoxin family protein [Pseudarcicella sp.]MBP6410989.1 thioredoxin family protein [Pseudarcicella sp.]
MRKIFVLLFLILSAKFYASAQGHKIEVSLPTNPDTTFYLAQHTDDGFFVKDTARSDHFGNMVFDGKNTLEPGMYVMLLQRKALFSFLLVDQYFQIIADSGKTNREVRFVGSKEAILYDEFLKQSNAKFKQVKTNNFTQEMYLFAQDYLLKAKNTLAEKVIRANLSPMGFKTLGKINTKQDSVLFNKQMLLTFWNNIDFTDERLANMPFIATKWKQYFELINTFSNDTLCKISDDLINKTNLSSPFRKKMIVRMANTFIGSKYQGHDSVYVHLAEKYMLNSDLFPDSSTQAINIGLVSSYKPNLIGKTLQNFTVADTLNRFFSLNTAKSPYFIVVFYDPGCHHCQDFIKELTAKQAEFKKNGVDIWLICNDLNKNSWMQFVRNLPINSFVHGFDLKRNLNIRQTFNVQTLPTVYLLDKNYKILANKKIKVTDYFNLLK